MLIENVRVWDGANASVREKYSVEISETRIHWLGPASEWRGNRKRTEIFDGSARTLIPGLMDCHVHYSSPGGPEWIARFTDPIGEISARYIELAGASVRSGVTTARDVGAPDDLNVALARRARVMGFLAPHLHAAGTWIAHRGTYVPFARQFASADELRNAIRAEIDAGVDLIKVALAPWNANQKPDDAPEIPFDEKYLAIAVEEARAAKMKIACHASDAASCKIAARAGVDSIEHGFNLDADDLAQMKTRGTFFVPTMSAWDAMLFFAREMDWASERVKRIENYREGSRAAVTNAIKMGINIALGTDAGGGAARHGRIAREIELMIECGMAPVEALIAGTARAAQLIGEEEARGVIAPGKIADLILLDGNPLDDPGALRLIAAVFQNGKRVT
ncbi:MAG: amidohydrolase family protein [Chloroflexi bacterium]|nr:amidohydrolase family protein [Chloroflexota bacterium]